MLIRLRTDVVDAEIARRGMLRKDLADLLGTTPTYVSDMLNGKMHPGPKMRQRFLKALDKKFEDLFDVATEEPARR